MRRRVLLLPLRPREVSRPRSLQGSGGAVPENTEDTAAEPVDQRGAVAGDETPAVFLRLLRR